MRWPTVRKKLLASGYVEYFSAKIDSKPRPCMRLITHPFQGRVSCLVSISVLIADHKDKGDSDDRGTSAQEVEEAQNQNSVLVSELPIDHQLFHLIDARGAEGMTQTVHIFPLSHSMFSLSGLTACGYRKYFI